MYYYTEMNKRPTEEMISMLKTLLTIHKPNKYLQMELGKTSRPFRRRQYIFYEITLRREASAVLFGGKSCSSDTIREKLDWWLEILNPKRVLPVKPQIIIATDRCVYYFEFGTGKHEAASGALAPRSCPEGRINKLNEETQSYATYQCNGNGR